MGLRVAETSEGFLNITPVDQAANNIPEITIHFEDLGGQVETQKTLTPENVSNILGEALVKTTRLVSSCTFIPFLVPGVLEATAHWEEEENQKEISIMRKKRNLFYCSLPFITYGVCASGSFGTFIFIGGAALALKNLTGLHSTSRLYQARWIG